MEIWDFSVFLIRLGGSETFQELHCRNLKCLKKKLWVICHHHRQFWQKVLLMSASSVKRIHLRRKSECCCLMQRFPRLPSQGQPAVNHRPLGGSCRCSSPAHTLLTQSKSVTPCFITPAFRCECVYMEKFNLNCFPCFSAGLNGFIFPRRHCLKFRKGHFGDLLCQNRWESSAAKQRK